MKVEHSNLDLKLRENTKAVDPRRGTIDRAVADYQKEFTAIITDFAKAVPETGTQQEYNTYYEIANSKWRTFCHNRKLKQPWLNVDPDLFETHVARFNRKVLRSQRPLRWLWTYYIKRALPLVALSGLIYVLYEYVYIPFIIN